MRDTMQGLREHYTEALQYFPERSIVGIFLQGSQNYGLDVETSDIDTKLIVVPSFEDIALNRKAVSTTHVRENDEHIDFKDVRLMIATFRKQNLNFVETLFTSFSIVNPMYAKAWGKLTENRERIAHYSPYQAVKTMKGIAEEKFHAMEHRYPSKIAVIDQYGYDPKQLHHLLRVQEYLRRYIAGESYEACLKSTCAEYLKNVKRGCYDLEMARGVANAAIEDVREVAKEFCERTSADCDMKVDVLLNQVQYEIMEIAVKEEMRLRER